MHRADPSPNEGRVSGALQYRQMGWHRASSPHRHLESRHRLPVQSVQPLGQFRVETLHEVPVGVHGDNDAGVPEPGLDGFGVCALLDEPGGVGVPQVMEPQRATETGGLYGWVPEALAPWVGLGAALAISDLGRSSGRCESLGEVLGRSWGGLLGCDGSVPP